MKLKFINKDGQHATSCHRSNQILNVTVNRARDTEVSIENNINKERKERIQYSIHRICQLTNSQTVCLLDKLDGKLGACRCFLGPAPRQGGCYLGVDRALRSCNELMCGVELK